MPLERQYKADRFLHTKRLAGMWATDTINGRVNSLYGKLYVQVFSNGIYFVKIYPIAKKADSGQALKAFLVEIGVNEELVVNGSKE